jgi:ATP-dependent RNA helicase DDX31/DBP7
MGGESVKKEKSRLRKGLNVLICTPGRLLYHLRNTQSLTFEKLQYLIFDESDRILDMGFEKEMTECLMQLKYKNRRMFLPTCKDDEFLTTDRVKITLVSATLGSKINKLSQKLMVNETRVGFDFTNQESEKDEENLIDLKMTIPATIKQFYMKVPNHKFKLLYLL